MANFIREACVENLSQAILAEQKGADRIELCADLDLDGLTPSEELIVKTKQALKIPIRVMIRPRGGDFIYSSEELKTMITAIECCKTIGVEGVVFGILNTDQTLNLEQISRLGRIAKPLKAVIHKAIDVTPNPLEAVKKLKEIEDITTILTSGGAKTAFEGIEVLKQMLQCCQNKIEVMPAGKITSTNIQRLHRHLGATAYHGKRIVG